MPKPAGDPATNQAFAWDMVKESLGLTDLPFVPQRFGITRNYQGPSLLVVEFTRELTPEEDAMVERIMTRGGIWPARDEEV